MNSHMPMKTRRRAQLELLAHEFEAIPKRVDLGQHLDYVLMELNDKIEKG